MDIPKNIKIGGQDVEIVLHEWTRDAMGASDIVPNKLYISSACSHGQQESTLLHEIIEYINSTCNLGLVHNQMATLETMLYQVLRDNKLNF